LLHGPALDDESTYAALALLFLWLLALFLK
jgi:hypothetical protein